MLWSNQKTAATPRTLVPYSTCHIISSGAPSRVPEGAEAPAPCSTSCGKPQEGFTSSPQGCCFVRKIHQHIFNQRNDQQHKLARMLVSQFGMIFVEDLNVKGLAGGMLAKAVHDASWSSFVAKLAYKAEEAGRLFAKVDARGTSQRCPCGAKVPKKLSDREHVCTKCGLITARDHASATEILRLGLSLHTLTKSEVGTCVV